jgi:hypothetical protein
MKKILTVLILLIFYSSSFAQSSEKHNVISDLNAKISKGGIVLNWNVINPKNISSIFINAKKSGSVNSDRIKDLDFNNYFSKNLIDSNAIFSYTFKHKPKENGVYYFQVVLVDIFNSEVSSNEIKIGFSEIQEFKLYQNNPNPFNPSTSITYDILSPTNVSLKVYDLSGKEIEVLVDEFQQPGSYKMDFNASKFGNFASGIYFYKMQTNSSSDIKKMIFAK